MLLLSLNFSPFQRGMAGWAGKLLAGVLHTEVSIGRVEIGLFNRVTLHDVVIRDQRGEQLLEAGLLSAKIEYMPLLHGEIVLRTVSMLDARVNLYKQRADTPPNFQFVLDAFRPEHGTEKHRRWGFHINSLILRRCGVSYQERFTARKPDGLDVAHLRVTDLGASISLRYIAEDSLNLRVRNLQVKEQCGLNVRAMSFRMAANLEQCEISRFELRLPATVIRQERLYARYNARDTARFFETMSLEGRLQVPAFSTRDVVGLIPALRSLDQNVRAEILYRKRGSQLDVEKLDLLENEDRYRLQGAAHLSFSDKRLRRCRVRLDECSLNDSSLVRLVAKWSGRRMPPVLREVFPLRMKGMANIVPGGRSQGSAELETPAGSLYAALHGLGKSYTLQLSSTGLTFKGFSTRRPLPSELAFHLDTSFDVADSSSPVVEAALLIDRMNYLEWEYGQIKATARWARRRLDASLQSDDENLKVRADFTGHFDGKRFQTAGLEASFEHLSPSVLGVTDRFGAARFSSAVHVDLRDTSPSHMSGTLFVRNFSMQSENGDSVYHLDSLRLNLRPSDIGTRLRLTSDFARAEVDGPLSVPDLKDCVKQFFASLLEKSPALAEAEQKQGSTRKKPTPQWRFYIGLYKTDFLEKLLNVPLSLDGPLTLQGNLRGDGGRVSVTGSTSGLDYGGVALHDLRFYLNGEGGAVSCLAQTVKRVGETDMRLALSAHSADGKLESELRWDDGGLHKYYGALRAVTTAKEVEGERQIVTDVVPTQMAIADTIWTVSSGHFVWAGKRLAVDSFLLSHADQALSVNGRVSPDTSDSIVARLQKLNISYMLSLVNLRPVSFSGQATGYVSFSPAEDGGFSASAQLEIPQFYFNDGLMGRTNVNAHINFADTRLYLNADMREDSIGGRTQVDGYVGIKEKALDLRVASQKTNLHFLRRYVSEILGDVAGRTTGHCRIYGPFKQLDFEGREKASVSAEVLATGVTYQLSEGTVDFAPGEFRFNKFKISDNEGGSGSFEGRMQHTNLKQVRYDFDVTANRLHVYDKPRSVDLPFYANVYGTGRVRLYGFPGTVSADIDLRPDRKTFLTYIVNTPDAFDENGLLELRPARPDSLLTSQLNDPEARPSVEIPDSAELENEAQVSNIYLNFVIDMNPAATLRVITDEKAGDNLLLSGSGPIRATFYNKGNFQMFGTFAVDYGTYRMSIQNVIRKNFTLKPGGTISFSGNPYNGDLDLQAVYTVPSASLADLGLGTNFSDNSVRADCILQLTGKVASPQIGFDLELPDVSDDVAQMVRQLISTEEDLNMQIIYLLGVGRFYTYNFASTEAAAGGQSQSSVAMKSFLSSTLSGQLNDIIADAIGYSNWSFGTNLSTGQTGWSDMEVAGLLSGHLLNNRLLINGNFGYRDRPTSTTNFVGDFDIQYLLTPSGSVSLKAYSETNDRYFTKSALTTQGIGIRLSRDFTNLRDLFQVRRRKTTTDSISR